MKSTTAILSFIILFPQLIYGSEWVSLFDGKTLNGWIPLNDRAAFYVQDGAIVGSAGSDSGKATLVQAVMCKSVEKHKPVDPAVVFAISQGEVVCFSKFDPVNEKTLIFQKWYKYAIPAHGEQEFPSSYPYGSYLSFNFPNG